MKTNSKEVKKLVKAHVLNCVYDYNERQFATFEDAKAHLLNEFRRVSDHANGLKRYPNDQNRFSNYMQGIPFHFEYTTTGINNFLNALGINPENQTFGNEKSMHLYHYLIFRAITK